MRFTTGWLWLWFLPLALAACEAAGDRARGGAEAQPGFADERAAAIATMDDFGPRASVAGEAPRDADAGEPSSPKALGEPATEGRLLVYRGQVRVEVARPDEVMASFRAQVVAWGGHLQSQSDRTLVVRVPAARFDEAFNWVRGSGRVLAESRQADDVTEEFVDLGIRIDNARKARDRLLEVLQKADKVEDILKVEAELRRLTEEIERMEGRHKLLADQVALATLAATFQAVAEAPIVKRNRQPSRFSWINRIGAERVMEDF